MLWLARFHLDLFLGRNVVVSPVPSGSVFGREGKLADLVLPRVVFGKGSHQQKRQARITPYLPYYPSRIGGCYGLNSRVILLLRIEVTTD
ncbi:MAG: hypothetical protein KatS3mg087_1354 [Patescibacteria group bacterium]|nr:MAG: hypothetical protein KatS3mg087_1354 [Patescibacteria group bacterium]